MGGIKEMYYGYLDIYIYNMMISKSMDINYGRYISEVIVGYEPQVSYLFGTPISVSEGGMYIDVDDNRLGLTPTDSENVEQNALECRGFMIL